MTKSETIEQMRKRHEHEIKKLQENCIHEETTEWSEWYWAIGHKALSYRKWCKLCGKLMGENPFTEVES